MSDVVIGASLQLNDGQAQQSMKSFKQQVKEANYELIQMGEKFGLTSKEAAEAAKKVAALKDAMGDAKALADAFNPDRKFAAFSIALRGVTSGFAAMQGAMGLVGAESEDLQKTLLKVQSAMAISEGVNGLLELKDGFKIVQNVAVNAFQKIKAAIGATGIGLLVLAVGALYTYWDDIKELVGGVSDEQDELNKKTNENLKAQQDKLKSIGDQDNILKLQGKSESEILKMKIAQTDEVIETAKVSVKNAEVTATLQLEAAKRNKEFLKSALDFITWPLKKLTEGFFFFVNKGLALIDMIPGVDTKQVDVSQITGAFDKANEEIAKMLFDPEKTKAEGDEVIKAANDTLNELKNNRAGYQLSIKSINDAAHTKHLADLTKQAEEEQKLLDYLNKQKTKLAQEQKALDEEPIEAPVADEETKDASTGSGTLLGQLSPEEWERKNALIRELTMSAAAIRLQDMQYEFDQRLAMVAGNEAAELALKQQFEDQKTALAWDANKKRLDIVASVLGQAADLIGKETVAGKALAIAEASINTYVAATSILKNTAKNPVTGAIPGFAIAQMAMTIIAGLATVKKIVSTPIPGRSGGGGGSMPSLSSSSPLQPQVQTTTLNQNQVNQIGNAASGGVGRSYVLDADVQDAAQRNNRIKRAAQLG